jgi:hypothetical protein
LITLCWKAQNYSHYLLFLKFLFFLVSCTSYLLTDQFAFNVESFPAPLMSMAKLMTPRIAGYKFVWDSHQISRPQMIHYKFRERQWSGYPLGWMLVICSLLSYSSCVITLVIRKPDKWIQGISCCITFSDASCWIAVRHYEKSVLAYYDAAHRIIIYPLTGHSLKKDKTYASKPISKVLKWNIIGNLPKNDK